MNLELLAGFYFDSCCQLLLFVTPATLCLRELVRRRLQMMMAPTTTEAAMTTRVGRQEGVTATLGRPPDLRLTSGGPEHFEGFCCFNLRIFAVALH